MSKGIKCNKAYWEMEAGIKGTNIIVKCRGIGTLVNENKGIECQHIDGSIEVIPADCLIELGESFDIKEQFDWFRAEAAKDILCAMIGEVIKQRNGSDLIDNTVRSAIVITDNLISKLKEKEEK